MKTVGSFMEEITIHSLIVLSIITSFCNLTYALIDPNSITEYKLTASDGAAGDYMSACAISGNRCLLGAFGDDDKGSNSGSAYVFQWNGTNWVQQAKLNASDGSAGDYFGDALDFNGDRCVIGAPYKGSGAAYIFQWDGTNWVQQAKFAPSGAGPYFGIPVMISGDFCFISSYYQNGKGAVYVYQWNGSAWVQQSILTASDGSSGDGFGYSLGVSDNLLIVGAHAASVGRTSHCGAAYIFQWNGTSWVQQAKLTASDKSTEDFFGIHSSISGNRCIVGSYYDDDKGSNSGSAYIFEWDGTNWVQEAKLLASDGASGDNFGVQVGIINNSCIVGAWNNNSTGAAYIFEFDSQNWVQRAKLRPSDGASGDLFGAPVRISDNFAICGSTYNDAKGTDSGAGYIYMWGQLPPPDALQVNAAVPPEDFQISGPQGGPFTPSSKDYTLTNTGPNSLDWTAEVNAGWLNVSPQSGSLSPSEVNTVTVFVDAEANNLLPGDYNSIITFTDVTSGIAQTRQVNLHIVLNNIGEIDVNDSIPPYSDLNMPFGDEIIGLSRTESITISNVHPTNSLMVSDINLGNLRTSVSASDLTINLPAVTANSAGSGHYYTQSSYFKNRQAQPLLVKAGYRRLIKPAKVLILATDVEPLTLANGLAGFSDINNVGYFNLSSGVPTLDQLKQYDVVIIMSNSYLSDSSQTGNVLADYVDSGGKVIQSVAAFATGGGWELSGRFVSGDYEPFVHGPGDFTAHSLGNFDNTHPIMAGISAITDSAPAAVSLKPQAQWVASWSNGTPLVATRNYNVVGIDIFAYDDAAWTGDVVLLFHNAAVWLVSGGTNNGGNDANAFSLSDVPSLPALIPPGGSITVNVAFAPKEIKEYKSSVIIKSDDIDEPQIAVALDGNGIGDYMQVSPDANTTPVFSGHPGGPFMPSKIVYMLHNNNSSVPISWSASSSDWFTITPASGTISPLGSASVTVKTSSSAAALPQGDYNSVITFTDTTTTVSQQRNLALHIFTAPKIWIDPSQNGFNVSVPQLKTLTQKLTIGNTGDADLAFSISSNEILTSSLKTSSAVTALESDSNEIDLEYSFEKPSAEKLDDYDLLRIKALGLYTQTGKPIVPIRPVEILIPYGKEVIDCQAEADSVQDLDGTYFLPPAQKPYPLNYTGMVSRTLPDAAAYNSDSPWPGEYFEKIGVHSKCGYQILLLNIFPLQYVPSTGKVSYADKISLKITLADSQKTPAVMPLDSAKARINATIDNPAELSGYPDDIQQQQTENNISLLPPGGPYKYVVITSQALKDAPGPMNFQALCNARNNQGLSATIITTEWIYANYDGTKPSGGSDNQTKIRNFLIDAYHNWGTEYVLLGGAIDIVPARMFWVDSKVGDTDYMPVDMYYACLDPVSCTFDYDADNKYGEPTDGPNGGDIDLLAEVYVGRAPVENAQELANFVNKVLTYDTTDSQYLPRIAMIGEYLGFGGVSDYATASMEQIRTGGTFDGYYTHGFIDNNLPGPVDFNTIGSMPNSPGCSWPLYDAPGYSWPASSLTCLMNGGVHIFNHLGHANYTYCMKLYSTDLPSLANNDYFFVYSQGCEPGGFDIADCFAEVLTTIPNGAFGTVMNARYGYGMSYSTDGPSQRYARQFWDAPLGEGKLEIGRANQDSKEDNAWNINSECMRWIYYELNLFGDPAQKFRFGEPKVQWLSCVPDSGVVSPGASTDVNVVFTAGQEFNTYYANILITSNDPYNPQITVPVTMKVEPSPDFVITPQDGLNISAVFGGPFEPNSQVYTISNNGGNPINWQADNTAAWLSVEPNSGTLNPGDSVDVNVWLNANVYALEPNNYSAQIIFTDQNDSISQIRQVSLRVVAPDMFTELFDKNDNDLHNMTLTLTPENSGHFYSACLKPAVSFPTDPDGGSILSLKDDDYIEVDLTGGKLIPFFRQDFDSFYVGSNGYITFDYGDDNPVETLENHFDFMRISALFDDLNPAVGGTVSWKQLDNCVAVTYQNVPEYGVYNRNNFQIEMFFDGTIRITWLGIAAHDGLAGISAGNGLPDYFLESDISSYGSCLTGDFNRDGKVDLLDLLMIAEHWLGNDCSVPGWCDGADLNRNGDVDARDLAEFANHWGQ